MDPIKDFLARYGAVPADNAGPVWASAGTDALLVHLRSMANARRAERLVGTAVNHARLAPLLADLTAVAAELWVRVGREAPAECGRILAGLALVADVLRFEAR